MNDLVAIPKGKSREYEDGKLIPMFDLMSQIPPHIAHYNLYSPYDQKWNGGKIGNKIIIGLNKSLIGTEHAYCFKCLHQDVESDREIREDSEYKTMELIETLEVSNKDKAGHADNVVNRVYKCPYGHGLTICLTPAEFAAIKVKENGNN
jgi:hypothetical protein